MSTASSSSSSSSSNAHEYDDDNSSSSPCPRTPRKRSWFGTPIRTPLICALALILSTTAWFSLVFSGSTCRCWRHQIIKNGNNWEGSPQSFHSLSNYNDGSSTRSSSSSYSSVGSLGYSYNYNLDKGDENEELALKHIVFGIAGSSNLWKRRKELVKLWWRSDEMRGHIWLDENVKGIYDGEGENEKLLLPPIMVSEDISHFRYTNPTGHPSGLRISRIVSECFRLGLPNVRWFVLGDDDTIFNVDNLVAVLSKYDHSEMIYVGSPSESHSANSYFSHSMAFGGGGIAISHPLAEALSMIQDDCLERYPKLYGSDDRLHACITELGIPLTRENGFHQWDIKGSAHGLLSSHPVTPFVSIHHVEAVEPFYPGLGYLESLKLFTRAMKVEPRSFLQRAICYDHAHRLTFSVSLGYVVQVFPDIVLPRELERSEQTYAAWNQIRQRREFDLDIRDPNRSVCKKPVLFFLKDIVREGNTTLSLYRRVGGKDDLKRKFLCFPRSTPLRDVQNIEVLAFPLNKNWHLVPRRLCCKVNQTAEGILKMTVLQCEKGNFNSICGTT